MPLAGSLDQQLFGNGEAFRSNDQVNLEQASEAATDEGAVGADSTSLEEAEIARILVVGKDDGEPVGEKSAIGYSFDSNLSPACRSTAVSSPNAWVLSRSCWVVVDSLVAMTFSGIVGDRR